MDRPRIPLWEKNRAAYGDFEPMLELHLLDSSEPADMVLVLPGGGYAMRADHEGAPVAQRFNALGFHAAVLHYRVAPRRYPDALADTLRAVQMLRLIGTNIGADKVAVLGFSAGGHLAACAGTLADDIEIVANDDADTFAARADALILCYPVISSGEYAHCGSFDNLAGDDAGLRDYLSAEKRVDAATPPTFLWHTAMDDAVPMQNSFLFAEAMRRHGRKVELHLFPEGGHGIGLAEGFSAKAWPELAADFLTRMMFTKTQNKKESLCLKELK